MKLSRITAAALACVIVWGCEDGSRTVELAVPGSLLTVVEEVAPEGGYAFYGDAEGYPREYDAMREGVLILCGPTEEDAGLRLMASGSPLAFRALHERYTSSMMVSGQAQFTETVTLTLPEGGQTRFARVGYAHGRDTPADSLARLCVSDLKGTPASVLLAGRDLGIPGEGVVRLRFVSDAPM